MALIRQIIKGRTVKTVDVEATEADLTALKAIMAGQLDSFELDSTSGTAGTLPAVLNAKKFSVGNNEGVSCSVSIPHVKPTIQKPNLVPLVVGQFDAHWDVSTSAERINLFYDSSKA